MRYVPRPRCVMKQGRVVHSARFLSVALADRRE